MGAPDVLHLLMESGLSVTASDGRLIVTPADRLTDETRQLIRDNKPGILDALAFTSFRWLVHFADREPMEIFCHPEKTFDKVMAEYPDCVAAEPLPERTATAADDRIWKVIGKLQADPGLRYVMDTHIEPEAVILTLAIKGKAACELRIPKSRYDAIAILELIEKHTTRETLQ